MLRFVLWAAPTVVVIVAVVEWYKVHRRRAELQRRLDRLELETSLKQEFLQAGMTAAEIVQVIRAKDV
jgi:cytochrome c-type biogenesis protein CcmH/NrfF